MTAALAQATSSRPGIGQRGPAAGSDSPRPRTGATNSKRSLRSSAGRPATRSNQPRLTEPSCSVASWSCTTPARPSPTTKPHRIHVVNDTAGMWWHSSTTIVPTPHGRHAPPPQTHRRAHLSRRTGRQSPRGTRRDDASGRKTRPVRLTVRPRRVGVVDANVLYSIELTDLLLTLAVHRLVRLHWSSRWV